MSNEPEIREKRKLSEASKVLLKREVERVESQLEEDYQRPIERHKEAEKFVAQLPPVTALLSLIFGALMALVAIPSTLSYHNFVWERQQRQFEQMQTPEELESYPTGQNWRAVTLMIPFAVLAVGLSLWGRRHRLAWLGLGLFGFSVLETALVAGGCEWSDQRARRTMVAELRTRIETQERVERERRQELERVAAEENRRLQVERQRLEEEERKRRLADQIALQRAVHDRQMAEMEAAQKAEQERQNLEVERKREEARLRKEEEARKKQEDEARKTAELALAREQRAAQLETAKAQLAAVVASREALVSRRDGYQKGIEERQKQIKNNNRAVAQLREDMEVQEGIVRGSEQLAQRARERRAELAQQDVTEQARKKVDDMERVALQRKAGAEQVVAEFKARITVLQTGATAAETEAAKMAEDLEKANAELAELDAQVDKAQTAVDDLQK